MTHCLLSSVLIANRGEIALRVIDTCRRLGIRTVAIHPDLDAAAPHVRAADDAVRVGDYLDIEAVIAAARESGAEAIHPGYGFLSERAAFAQAVADAGLVLIGPTAEVMEQMGRKDAAREIAIAAGVPVVPQYEPDSDRPGRFPVLVKAAAGGGGKGMRVVRSADELDEAIAAARREATSAFGDDTMLIETYVEHGRHIEVQVLGDQHGHVIHLFERDCSTQRRHQKVLEEAPGPTIDADLRDRLTSSAVALAQHVGYTNAGTVEFLLDADTGEHYFLEMNTRLQVEHPVTELITVTSDGSRLDLVEQQIRIASGLPLEIEQADLSISGHAIEARVYAEDSFGGFLPQAGAATLVQWPDLPDVRVDHALESGQVVSTSYDPMLGKVIAHGPDRESARRTLIAALDRTTILGITTNAGFLRTLLAGDEFRAATIDTAWLDRVEIDRPADTTARVLAAWVLAGDNADGEPFGRDGFRLGGDPAPSRVVLDEPVLVDRAAGIVTVGEAEHRVRQLAADPLTAIVDGERVTGVVRSGPRSTEVALAGQRFLFATHDRAGSAEVIGDGTLTAPMPGTVLDVRVEVGATVSAGDVLGAMEAMKMELSLTAPFDGTVTEVNVAAGAQVSMGAALFAVTAAEVS